MNTYTHCAHTSLSIYQGGPAIAQAVSRWLPTAAARVRARGLVKWDLWWTKWRRGSFSPSTSVSPANSFHQILHPHNPPGQVQ
jgi:hypothetical protein